MSKRRPPAPRRRLREPALLGLLFLVAAAVRLVVLRQLASSPLGWTPLVDAETYDGIARRLAGGISPGADLFWQPPLYPLFLGALYKISGSSIAFAKTIQALLGGGTCVLTYVLGKRLWGPRAGWIAGFLLALYGPLIALELDLVACGLAAFGCALLVLLFLQADDSPTPARLLILGVAGAAWTLIRPEFLLAFAGGCVWLALRVGRRRGSRAIASRALLVLLGFGAIALPAAALDRFAGAGAFSILPSSGSLNLYIGNNPDVCRTLTARPGWDWVDLLATPARNGARTPQEVQRWFGGAVTAYMSGHPLAFIGNEVAKLARFLSSREIPRNVDAYALRPWSGLLRILLWKAGGFGFPFGILLPLAALGGWRRRRSVPGVLWIVLGLYALSVVSVFVADRYRAPVVPLLALLAAAGILSLGEIARERRPRDLAAAGGIVAATLVLSCLPGPFCEEREDYRAELLYLIGLSHHHALLREGGTPQPSEIAAVGSLYERALDRNADLADAWNELGNLRVLQARYADAMGCYESALRARPNHGKAWHNEGWLLYQAGRSAAAETCLRKAVELDPTFLRSRYYLGLALLKQHKYADALDALGREGETENTPPARAERLAAVGDALSGLGRLDEARAGYRQALDVDPRCARAERGLAWLLATGDPATRDVAAARSLAEDAAAAEPSSPEALDALAAAYAAAGRFPEAVAIASEAAGAARSTKSPDGEALAREIDERRALYEKGIPYRRADR